MKPHEAPVDGTWGKRTLCVNLLYSVAAYSSFGNTLKQVAKTEF
jgi:hypothetical protein